MKNLFIGFGTLESSRFVYQNQDEIKKVQTKIESSEQEKGKEKKGEDPMAVEESEKKLLAAYVEFEERLASISDTDTEAEQKFREKAQKYVIDKDKEIDTNKKHLEQDLEGLDSWLEDNVENLYNPETTETGLSVADQFEMINQIDVIVKNLNVNKNNLGSAIRGGDIPKVLNHAVEVRDLIEHVYTSLDMNDENADDDLKYKLNELNRINKAIDKVIQIAEGMIERKENVEFGYVLSRSAKELFISAKEAKGNALENAKKYRELLVKANNAGDDPMMQETYLLTAKLLRKKIDPENKILKRVDNIPFDKEQQAIEAARKEKLDELRMNVAQLVQMLKDVKKTVAAEEDKDSPDRDLLDKQSYIYKRAVDEFDGYKAELVSYGFTGELFSDYDVDLNVGLRIEDLKKSLKDGESLVKIFKTELPDFVAMSGVSIKKSADGKSTTTKEAFKSTYTETFETRTETLQQMSVFGDEDQAFADYAKKVGVSWSKDYQFFKDRFGDGLNVIKSAYLAAQNGDELQAGNWQEFINGDEDNTLYRSFRSPKAPEFKKDKKALKRHKDWIKASFIPLKEGAGGNYEPNPQKTHLQSIENRKQEEGKAAQERLQNQEALKQKNVEKKDAKEAVLGAFESLPSDTQLPEENVEDILTQLKEGFKASTAFEKKFKEKISLYYNKDIKRVRDFYRDAAETFIHTIDESLSSNSLEKVNQALDEDYSTAEMLLEASKDVDSLLKKNIKDWSPGYEDPLVLPKKKLLKNKKKELEKNE